MKKGLKTKLGLSVMSLGLLAGALSTSTYAWFTTNATATTNEITVNSQATSDSIYLSTDGINFGKSVTIAAENIELDAVTYNSDKYVNLSNENVTESGGTDSVPAAILKFDLYFKTTVADESAATIYFDDATTKFVTSNEAAFTLLGNAYDSESVNEDLGAGKTYTGYLTNATRLAVTPYGVVTGATTGGATGEFIKGTRTAYTTIEEGKTELGGVTEVKKGAFPYYQNVMKPGDGFTNPYAAATEPKTENGSSNAAQIEASSEVATKVSSGKIAKVEFAFYIEGWDADAFDTILGQTVAITLGFNLTSSSSVTSSSTSTESTTA